MTAPFPPLFLFILLSCFAFISCTSEDENKSPLTAPGISWELAKHRSKTIDQVNYRLFFNIPESKSDSIVSSLQLSFKLKDSKENYLILDFNAPSSHIVSVSNTEGTPLKYEHVSEHILLPVDQFRIGQLHQLNIEFIAGETGLNRHPEYIYTLLVPDRASTVFPCFDQPDIKATYNLSLALPADWVGVSAAPLAEKRKENDRQVLVFETSDKISTYHFSFVAGKFKTIRDTTGNIPMTMYHRETDMAKVKANASEIFKLHQHSLQWLASYTSISFPFKKFDFVLIPGFQYGGMEHVGAIQYRAASLLLEEAPTTNQLLGRASLIAHETAHMWFGDLVTMRWFDDVWMKEVFANMMAAKIVHPFFPEVNHRLRFLLAHYPAAYSIDRTEGTHPIRQPLENLKQAGSLYGAIIYQKSPIMMRKLEELLGENNFKTGIQEYLRSYAHGVADWGDLITILDSKTKVNLQKWSHTWVDSPGMPLFQVGYFEHPAGNFLKLEQIDLTGRSKVWPQTFQSIYSYEDSNIQRPITFADQPKIEIRQTTKSFDPMSVSLDPTGEAYGIFDFGDRIDLGIYPFGYALLNIDKQADEILRAVQYIQLFEFFLYRESFPPSYPLFLERYLFQEKNKLNAELLLGQIETVFWRWLTPAQRKIYAERYEAMLISLIQATNDESLRYAYFKTLNSIALQDETIVKLLGIWQKRENSWGVKLSEDDYMQMAEMLAIKLPDEASDILATQRERIENPDRLERFDFVMPSLSSSQEVRDTFFAGLLDPNKRENEPWVLESLKYLHHPLRAQEAVKYLEVILLKLEEIQLTGDIFFPKRWLDESFRGHQSQEAWDIVQTFLNNNPDYNPRLKMKILQSTDMLKRVTHMHEAMGHSSGNNIPEN